VKPFEEFYDSKDMSTCVIASTSVAEVNERAAPDGLYFPLWLDMDMAVGDLVLRQPYTSRSFRYGSVADNVLGMNFRLVTGKMVKVGGQVVKNATGFDFTRFLCQSGRSFGSAERAVLRLRPLEETSGNRVFTGDRANLREFTRSFLRSQWSQIVDAVDFAIDPGSVAYHVGFSCPASWVEMHDRHLSAAAREHDLECSEADCLTPSIKSFARVKTTISTCMDFAGRLVDQFGGHAHGFAGNGYFHYDPPQGGEANTELSAALQALHGEVGALGGHVECRAMEAPEDTIERQWEDAFKLKLEALE
jgi:hypothetical protein